MNGEDEIRTDPVEEEIPEHEPVPPGLPRDPRALHPLAVPAIWFGALGLIPFLRLLCLAPVLFWLFGSPPAKDDAGRRGRIWMQAGMVLGVLSLVMSLSLAWSMTALHPEVYSSFFSALRHSLVTPWAIGQGIEQAEGVAAIGIVPGDTVFTVISIAVLIVAVVLHEIAHGWSAWQLGDPTAASRGRLSLNPIRHFDLFGTLILPGMLALWGSPVVFGWARPVPVDPRRFNSDPWRGMAVTSVAGPAANALQALVWGGVMHYAFVRLAVLGDLAVEKPLSVLYVVSLIGVLINLFLGVLNMIPVPPLDGSKVLAWILPRPLAVRYLKIGSFGLLIIFALFYFNLFGPIVNWLILAGDFLFTPHSLY